MDVGNGDLAESPARATPAAADFGRKVSSKEQIVGWAGGFTQHHVGITVSGSTASANGLVVVAGTHLYSRACECVHSVEQRGLLFVGDEVDRFTQSGQACRACGDVVVFFRSAS